MSSVTTKNCQEETKDFSVSKTRFFFASLYTFGYLSIPIVMMSKKQFFKRFCSFHVRKLSLASRTPIELGVLAILLSLFYTGLSIPVYLKGLKWIFGMESVGNLKDLVRSSIVFHHKFDETGEAEEVSKKIEALKDFDKIIIGGLDELAGAEEKVTQEAINRIYGRN